ncbi:MAG TPA: DNA polymerase LigD, partial [Streptosporangiaceae bacterium]
LLAARLTPLHQAASPFADELPREHARGAVWVRPLLVIEVAFAIWTPEGRLRAAVYQGLRDDKDPAEVIREP